MLLESLRKRASARDLGRGGEQSTARNGVLDDVTNTANDSTRPPTAASRSWSFTSAGQRIGQSQTLPRRGRYGFVAEDVRPGFGFMRARHASDPQLSTRYNQHAAVFGTESPDDEAAAPSPHDRTQCC
ncbi:hypothetical protein MRB53_039234 [Persea americana]|nr:hypothetical protein MRB53_039234 [Persea americana]